MEIYLAASWRQRKRMRMIAEYLTQNGHGFTSSWIFSEDPNGMGPTEIAADSDKAEAGGARDVHDINRADRVAVFTDIPSSTGGFHVEYGYAIGNGKPVDVIGPRPNVFYALDGMYEIRHFPDAIAWFDQLHKDMEK